MSNEELISILEKRFITNEKMHKEINWNDVLKRLNNEEKLYYIPLND